MVHEFGHSFAGLADEYAYEQEQIPMYPHDVEPWEKNITTLADFHGKWENMIDKKTKIPTPLSKKEKEAVSKVGVFEGAGYSVKGVYRGVQDCRMRINETPEFCPVCKKALQDIIDSLDLFKHNISAHGASFLSRGLLGCPRQGSKGGSALRVEPAGAGARKQGEGCHQQCVC